MTLGRHSGAALIGRPLDIRAQVLLAPGDDPSALCLSAEVFYGDVQVTGVRTQLQQGAPGAETSLRIQVPQAVNEPVVTVFVKAGCEAPFTRQYVLLADPVSEPLAPQAGAAEPPVPVVVPPAVTVPAEADLRPAAPVVSPAAAPATRPAEAVPAPASTRAPPVAKRPPARTDAPRRPAPTGSVVRRAPPPEPAAAPSGPRLQLDPVDLGLPIDRDPTLRLSSTLLSEPSSSEEARKEAGALWKALNASPEEVMRDLQKMAVLEAEAKGLREEEARNRAMIAELNSRLDEAQQRNWLTYLLALLLLLSLLALAVVMRKRRSDMRDAARAKAWWNEEVAQRPLTEAPQGPAAASKSGADLDIDLASPASDSSLSPLSQPAALGSTSAVGPRKADARDFAPSAIGVSRSVATEELFDVQQQADFFISLGEDEQAIQVLKDHLAESPEPSPLAYLDLLKLYHRLGRRSEYDAVRDRFNEVFNAGAPRFEHFSDRGLGLEGYETAMGRIEALWPQPRVLDVIEKSIFRDPNDRDGEVFDLEAYRELLFLHALAKDIIRKEQRSDEAEVEPSRPGFGRTRIQPLKAAVVAAEAAAGAPTQPQEIFPPASPNLGLDVDLDELAELSAFEASLPDVAMKVEPTARTANPGGQNEPPVPSNLIDFEVLDFLPSARADIQGEPPEAGEAADGKAGPKGPAGQP